MVVCSVARSLLHWSNHWHVPHGRECIYHKAAWWTHNSPHRLRAAPPSILWTSTFFSSLFFLSSSSIFTSATNILSRRYFALIRGAVLPPSSHQRRWKFWPMSFKVSNSCSHARKMFSLLAMTFSLNAISCVARKTRSEMNREQPDGCVRESKYHLLDAQRHICTRVSRVVSSSHSLG